MKKVKQRKDDLIKKSVNGITEGLENDKNITYFRGEASFISDKTININGQEITGDKVFINVGARARIPEGFENVDYLTNESILQLEEVPEHLVIVGGSYIGLEFGQMFRRFSSKVTIIEMGPRLIAREDESVSRAIHEILENEGIQIRTNASCPEGTSTGDGNVMVKLACDDGPDKISGSHLLLAVGRVPNSDLLNLENTNIKTDERGNFEVNDHLETNVNGVYALGGCNGKGAFTHTAVNDFQIIANNLIDGGDRKVSDRILNYALYIDPPIGRAGLTLKQAK